MPVPPLHDDQYHAVKNSEVGQFLDRLVREEFEKGGDTAIKWEGDIIQALWAAFHPPGIR